MPQDIPRVPRQPSAPEIHVQRILQAGRNQAPPIRIEGDNDQDGNNSEDELEDEIENPCRNIKKGLTEAFTPEPSRNSQGTNAGRYQAVRDVPARNSPIVRKVQHILLSWRQSFSATTPDKLVYVLEEKYPSDRLSVNELKGADARNIGILQLLAKECRFRIHLATVRLTVKGEIDEDEEGRRLVAPGATHEWTFLNIFSLDGQKIDFPNADSKFNYPRDFFPRKLNGGRPRSEKSDGYWGGDVEQLYFKTVVLIWPENRHRGILGNGWLSNATAELKESTTRKPSPKEKLLCQRMMIRLRSLARLKNEAWGGDAACYELCVATLRWRSSRFWLSAANLGQNTTGPSFLSIPELVNATATFGFDKVKSLLTDHLINSDTSVRRFELLAALRSPVSEQDPDFMFWYRDQRSWALNNLRKATQADVPAFVTLAQSLGIPIIQSTAIPQLLRLDCDREFWFAFLSGLKSNRETIPPSVIAVDDVIKATLASFLERTHPLSLAAKAVPFAEGTPTYDSQPTIRFVNFCVELECPNSCTIIFDKLHRSYAQADEQTRSALISEVWSPLMAAINSCASPPHSINIYAPPFRGFSETIASQILNLEINRDQNSRETDWPGVIEAAKFYRESNGLTYLKDEITERLAISCNPPVVSASVAKILQDRWASDAGTDEGLGLQRLIRQILTASILRGDISVPSAQYAIRDGSAADYLQNTKELLVLCFETNNVALLPQLLSRLKSTATLSHYTSVALPFIEFLSEELPSRGTSLSSDPYAAFCRDVLTIFVDRVLDPRPVEWADCLEDALKALNCGCGDCEHMLNNLSKPDPVVEIRQPAPIRAHLEKQIDRCSNLGLRYHTNSDRRTPRFNGGCYGLVITKPDWIMNFGQWSRCREVALAAINAIPSGKHRRSIFGNNYGRILDKLATCDPEVLPIHEAPRAGTSKRSLPSSFGGEQGASKRGRNDP